MELAFPSEGLIDGVVRVRAWRRDDLDALVAACQDPEIPRWTTVPSPYTRAHGVEFLANTVDWMAGGTDAAVAIVDATDDGLLGATGVHRIGADPASLAEPWQLTNEVGYWLSAAARGRGVATRGVSLVCDWALAVLELPQLRLQVYEGNERSVAVAERCGFTFQERRPAPPPSRAVLLYERSAH